jgi:hypothetical protein
MARLMDQAVFKFDAVANVYRLGDRTLPRVTDIINPLLQFANINPQVLEYARQKGQAIHAAVKLHNADDLDINSLDPAIIPRYEAWLKFLADKKPVILGFEQPMYSSIYNYAGTPDLWMAMDDDIWLPDIKPNSLLIWYPIQLSGYQQILKEQLSLPQARRATLQLKDDGKYRFTPYQRVEDAKDMSTFLSLLNIISWRQCHDCYSRSN